MASSSTRSCVTFVRTGPGVAWHAPDLALRKGLTYAVPVTISLDRPLADFDDAARRALLTDLREEYAQWRAKGLDLDITRGKPSPEQLDLSNALLSLPGETDFCDRTNNDLRNYGNPKGVVELREIFAELLSVPTDNIVTGLNSSLSLMHDVLTYALLHGIGDQPSWREQEFRSGQRIKFICPVPGYDRHFTMSEHHGIELLPTELGPDGPDVDECARLARDPMVKGMWAMPAYSNPSGCCYSEEVTRGLLSMPAAADFRLWWDNAYVVHHLTDAEPAPHDVLGLAAECGHPDRVFEFASTSKITFAGGGVAFLAASTPDLHWYMTHSGKRTIGPDKVNEWRHARFFHDADGVRAHMRRHRALMTPKFAAVAEVLGRRLGAADVATWTSPEGGYFVSLYVLDHTATRVVELASDAGVALTPAGAAYPHGHDPRDRHIRLAPTFPALSDVTQAMDVVATCVLLAACEQADGRRFDAAEG